MGPFATSILVGTLDALRWLMWLVAFLLLVLIVVQSLRGDADANPKSNFLLACGFIATGFVSGWAARKLVR